MLKYYLRIVLLLVSAFAIATIMTIGLMSIVCFGAETVIREASQLIR